MTFEKRVAEQKCAQRQETLLSCSAFSFFFFFFLQYSFFLCSQQKCNMHNFVCSLRRISAPVISIIIATTDVIDFFV